jgi:hypothetical protein
MQLFHKNKIQIERNEITINPAFCEASLFKNFAKINKKKDYEPNHVK